MVGVRLRLSWLGLLQVAALGLLLLGSCVVMVCAAEHHELAQAPVATEEENAAAAAAAAAAVTPAATTLSPALANVNVVNLPRPTSRPVEEVPYEWLALVLFGLPLPLMWWLVGGRLKRPGLQAGFRIRADWVPLMGTVPLVVASVVSIVYATVFHFEKVNKTHCHVPNIFPSISACVGAQAPEKHFWTFGVALSMTWWICLTWPINAMLRKRLHPTRLNTWVRWVCMYCHVGSFLSLGVLSFVSSTECWPVHERGFILWFVFTAVNMSTFVFLTHRTIRPWPVKARRGRMLSLVFFVCFFAMAMFLYWWHSVQCVPYLYSVFAVCEWLVVTSKVVHHCYHACDFDRVTWYTAYVSGDPKGA